MKDMVNPFSSKKFWYTMVALVVSVFVAYVPALQASEELLVSAFTALIMVALGVQTIQDVAKEKYGSVEPVTEVTPSA